MECRKTRYKKRRKIVKAPTESVDPRYFGVSFSLKQCRDFAIDPQETLTFLIEEMGFHRFRLMSYWNEHEKTAGEYDFSLLDKQIELIEKHGGIVSMCLGARQPRWPESHWPGWALQLPKADRIQALLKYISIVVERYKKQPTIVSWQLENEALNRGFGTNGDFNRKRLRDEYNLIKKLDPKRPTIMSTSNTFGIPLRRPRPDKFGFTLYCVQFEDGVYRLSRTPNWWYRTRRDLIKVFTTRDSFIHELQAEPWGPKAIWEMTTKEQDKSMGLAQIEKNIQTAINTNLYPIDLWGGEWWYWRYRQGDKTISRCLKSYLKSYL